MIYLSGVSTPRLRAIAFAANVGLITQPGNGYLRQLPAYPAWALDNGCFAAGERFNAESFLSYIDRAIDTADSTRCLFAVAPDVVFDAASTYDRALPILPEIRARGVPSAFVAQNGICERITPWLEFDVLFLGGNTAFKLSCHSLVREAKDAGKWVHMGRVNSLKRLQIALSMGCDSADGTFLKYAPDANLPRMIAWFGRLNTQQARLC